MHLRVPLVARLPTSLPPRFDQRQFISGAWFLGLTLSQLFSRFALQLLNIVLHRLSQIGNQVVAIRGWVAPRLRALTRRNTVSSLLLIPSRFSSRSPGNPPRA